MKKSTYALAIDAPTTDATLLTKNLSGHVIEMARHSPRRRILQRLHKTDNDPYQRMLNGMQPGSYFRPHRHVNPPKSETLIVLSGMIRVVLFDDHGTILDNHELSPEGENFGIDFQPTVFHTLIVLKTDTLIFESKTGPYTQATDKDFPSWAPAEGTSETTTYLENLILLTNWRR